MKTGLKDKLVVFTGDNANVNLEGVNQVSDNNDKVITLLNQNLPILLNAIRHAIYLLDFNVESLVMKIFSHFYVYTLFEQKGLKNFVFTLKFTTKNFFHSKTR